MLNIHGSLSRQHQYASSEIPALCEGGILSAHVLTLVGTKITPYIGITL